MRTEPLTPSERERLAALRAAFAESGGRGVELADEIDALAARESADDRPGITLTRDQLEAWAGRELTDDEVERLDEAIPNSSVPDAVGAIVDGIRYATREV